MAHGLAVVKLVAGRVFGIQGLVYERELFLHSLEQRDNRFLNNSVWRVKGIGTKLRPRRSTCLWKDRFLMTLLL